MPTTSSNTGSLIQIHKHDNLSCLNKLSETNSVLYFDGKPVSLTVSSKDGNAIQILTDGIFVDSSFLSTNIDTKLKNIITNITNLSNSLTTLSNDFNLHVNNTVIHVTQADKDLWNKKSNDIDITEAQIRAMIKEIWTEFDKNHSDIPTTPDIPDDVTSNFITSDNKVIITSDSKIFTVTPSAIPDTPEEIISDFITSDNKVIVTNDSKIFVTTNMSITLPPTETISNFTTLDNKVIITSDSKIFMSK